MMKNDCSLPLNEHDNDLKNYLKMALISPYGTHSDI